MTFLDYIKIGGAILVSLGGGGAIVFRFSDFLGKLWADRALQDYRHKHEELIVKLQNQFSDNSRRLQADLDDASRRLQLGLDTLKLVHDIRTKEEFQRLADLWKLLMTLFLTFHEMTFMGLTFESLDERVRRELKVERRRDFEQALHEAKLYFLNVMILIPEPISIVVEDLLSELSREPLRYRLSLGEDAVPGRYRQFIDVLTQRTVTERRRLERLIRSHTRGETLDRAASGDGER